MSNRSNEIILPGDSLDLDTDLPDQTVVVEGWLPHQWPDPQLVSISQGRLQVTNTSSQPVVLTNKRVNSVKITSTEDTDWTQPFLSTLKQEIRNVSPLSDSETIDTTDWRHHGRHKRIATGSPQTLPKSSAKTYQEDTTDTMAVTYVISTGPQHRDQKREKYL